MKPRSAKDGFGNPAYPVWAVAHPKVRLATLANAAAHGDLVINALSGSAAIAGLTAAGEANLAGKVVLDVSNPLDFSNGMPPSLFVSNTASPAEQIQARFPTARVVKSLNTVNASVMVDPQQVAGGDHTIFVSGNDPDARGQVTSL